MGLSMFPFSTSISTSTFNFAHLNAIDQHFFFAESLQEERLQGMSDREVHAVLRTREKGRSCYVRDRGREGSDSA